MILALAFALAVPATLDDDSVRALAARTFTTCLSGTAAQQAALLALPDGTPGNVRAADATKPEEMKEIERFCTELAYWQSAGPYRLGSVERQGEGDRHVVAVEVFFRNGMKEEGKVYAWAQVAGAWRLVDIDSVRGHRGAVTRDIRTESEPAHVKEARAHYDGLRAACAAGKAADVAAGFRLEGRTIAPEEIASDLTRFCERYMPAGRYLGYETAGPGTATLYLEGEGAGEALAIGLATVGGKYRVLMLEGVRLPQ